MGGIGPRFKDEAAGLISDATLRYRNSRHRVRPTPASDLEPVVDLLLLPLLYEATNRSNVHGGHLPCYEQKTGLLPYLAAC